MAAVMLLGLITYQAVMISGAAASPSVALPSIRKRRDVSGLAPIIAGLVAVTVILGGSLYPAYRMTARPFLESHSLKQINGMFEIKEHFAALALLSTPAYLATWRLMKDPKHTVARRALTYILAAIVWWNFLVGHVLRLITGLS